MKRYITTFDNSKYNINYITEFTEASLMARKLADSPIQNFGLDIETAKDYPHEKAGLDPHLSKISTVQLYDGAENIYVFDALMCGLEWFTLLTAKNFVAHYGIFEIKHLQKAGFANLNVGCSMLLSILVDRAERSPYQPAGVDAFEDEDEEEPASWKGYGLDAIVGRLFDIRIDKKWQTYDWLTRPLPPEPILYAALDAVLTYKISQAQFKKVKEYKMVPHYQLLKSMQHVIAEMELEGMYLDKDVHNKLIAEWESDLSKKLTECAKYFGDINLNSTKQLGNWARDKYSKEIIESWMKTKTGALGFGKNALANMQDLPEMALLLSYKKLAKLISTYGQTLAQQINPITQRIHCSFSLGETRTGRLSSRQPNLQNLPRESTMRSVFSTTATNKLVIADFNQIELRVAGEVSGDPVIRGAYERGEDLHKIFASKIYHVPLSRVTDKQRQIAKSANFGTIYGMGPNKFMSYCLASAGVRIPFDEAQHIITSLWQLYSVYGKWCSAIRHRAEVEGFIRTPMGKMRKLHAQEVYTKAPNTVVQGGAFEVMALAMVNLRSVLAVHSINAKIINSVHDELILETAEENTVTVSAFVARAMEYGMLSVFPNATMNGLAKIKVCDNWGEMK